MRQPTRKLESWVEETERKVRLIIDHYPRCQKCHFVILGSSARPWTQVCKHCGTLNVGPEVVS